MKILFDPVTYKAYLHHKKQEMEAIAELLLENAFKGDDMNGAEAGAPTVAEQPKVFGILVKELTSASILAEQLNKKSAGLISLFIDKSPKPREEITKEKAVQSPVLAHALAEVTTNINRNLLEISNNLDKLEKAW